LFVQAKKTLSDSGDAEGAKDDIGDIVILVVVGVMSLSLAYRGLQEFLGRYCDSVEDGK